MSSTQPRVVNWLRSHPQIALFAGALGVLALAVGLVAITRPPRVRGEVPPPVGGSDDVERLQMLLDFEQAARKENEVLFWKMAIHAGDAMHIMHPREGTVQWFGGIDAMLGYAQNSFPRTVDGWAVSIHPEESAKIVALYTTACRKKEEFKAEYRIRHRNGTYREWSHRGRPVTDERRNLMSFVGACTDVTERNRAQRDMRENEEKFGSVLQANPAAMLVCDATGRITLANTAAEQLFGCAPGTLADAPYAGGSWDIVDRDGMALLDGQMPHALVAAANAPLSDVEHAIERGNGDVAFVAVNGAPLHDASGAVSGAVLFLSDITERIQRENQTLREGFYDVLTGLAKRALFHDRLEHALQRAANAGTRIAILLLNNESWKSASEELGEGASEELLKITAQRLDGSLRVFDTAARLTGGEFAILLEDIPALENAQIVIDRVLEALLQPISLRGQELLESPRLGAALSRPRCAPEEIMSWATEALSAARHQDVRFAWHESSFESFGSVLTEESAADEAVEETQIVQDAVEDTLEADEKLDVTNGSSNGAPKEAAGLLGPTFYFSTNVVSDVVSGNGTVNGALAPGLAVHRVTSDGVLVDEETSMDEDDDAVFPHAVANGHVIKSLPPIHELKHELKVVGSISEESIRALQEERASKIPLEKEANTSSDDSEEVTRLLKQA